MCRNSPMKKLLDTAKKAFFLCYYFLFVLSFSAFEKKKGFLYISKAVEMIETSL